jgi:hypothetical protein
MSNTTLTPKFKRFDKVIVSGTATGYGDKKGYIEYEGYERLGKIFYQVRVYNHIYGHIHCNEIFLKSIEK